MEILSQFQQENYAKNIHPVPNYSGGMLGVLTYNSIHLFENINLKHKNNFYDLYFNCYETCITYIQQENKIIISTVTEINNDYQLEEIYHQANKKINDLIDIIYRKKSFNAISKNMSISKNFIPSIKDKKFIEKINQAKAYIKKGDAFQIVLSRKFKNKINIKPFLIYRAMRMYNPSPYSFFMKLDNFVLCGCSPEKFISIHNRIIESCPLAGTKAIQTADDEINLSEKLLQDEKEIAEHMMLVDLARNDLGRVCKPDSIKIKRLKEIEKFKRVIHISSTVQGELRDDKTIFDALKANFPAGTLSGAPKIRAMEIIDELETSSRGFYGGAICAIDNYANLDSCIAIRMAVLKKGIVEIQTGAGIVADSISVNEMQETYHKAKATIESIQLAEEGYL
jgi:anthranilate synthase component 1